MTKEVRLWGKDWEMWVRLTEWFRKLVPEVGQLASYCFNLISEDNWWLLIVIFTGLTEFWESCWLCVDCLLSACLFVETVAQSPSITPSLFHSRLKTHLFHKSFPHSLPIIDHPWTDFMDTRPAHWFFPAKHRRLSLTLSDFERAI